MNASTHRNDRQAERAPALLHPVMAAALAAFVPPSTGADGSPWLHAKRERLEAARQKTSALVDFRQARLDLALEQLHALDRELDLLDDEINDLPFVEVAR